MTKKKTLVTESVIRRWGKLANMAPLTENWLDEQDALEDEEAAAEDEIAAGEAEIEGGMEAEASVEEEAAVERIVTAVVDALADETGVDIEVEGGSDDEAAMDVIDDTEDEGDEFEDAGDDEMDDADAAAMRNPYNRRDLAEDGQSKDEQSKTRADYSKNKDKKADRKEDEKERKAYDKKKSKKSGSEEGDQSASKADFAESLDLDVIDDEKLTEAVLHRVVERLLKRK
jgi:hypothetical protein